MAKKRKADKRMAKSTSAKRGGPKPAARQPVTHRLTTIKPNGGLHESQEVAPAAITISEAMRRAVKELGDIKIDRDLAPQQLQQLQELAECYEHVAEEQAAFLQRAEAAKIAKKSLESAQALLLEKVRQFTHPAPLPLFDLAQAQEDHEEMVNGSGIFDGAEA